MDALKLKLKYHNDAYNKLIEPKSSKSKTELRLIDNGKFLSTLLKKRKEIIDIATKARLFEGQKDNDNAFEKWYETSALIDQFEEVFFTPEKIQWAKKVGFIYNTQSFIIGIISGVITSVIVQYLFSFIVDFFKK